MVRAEDPGVVDLGEIVILGGQPEDRNRGQSVGGKPSCQFHRVQDFINGVAGARKQSHLLAGHARRLGATVNLIPSNTVEGLEWARPSRARQERFLSILREHGTVATLRREKGHDIDAACGQLRLQAKRSEASPDVVPAQSR